MIFGTKKMKKAAILFAFMGLCSCTRIILPNDRETIILQHPVTREVFYCESGDGFSATICAAELEEQGFVRLKDKAVFPGHRDVVEPGTYPPRRFREKQDIPRW